MLRSEWNSSLDSIGSSGSQLVNLSSSTSTELPTQARHPHPSSCAFQLRERALLSPKVELRVLLGLTSRYCFIRPPMIPMKAHISEIAVALMRCGMGPRTIEA